MSKAISKQLPGEIWRDIPGAEGLYQVSDFGRVRSASKVVERADGTTRTVAAKILTPIPDADGYLRLRIGKSNQKKQFVHRLVALAFLGDAPPTHDVHHVNRIKTDNRPSNLQYIESTLHRSMHSRGESNGRAALSPRDVFKIRSLIAQRQTNVEIAARFGVTHSTISCIRRRKTWQHLPSIGQLLGRGDQNWRYTFMDSLKLTA